MTYPDYYTKIQPINLHDPLSEFLGAIDKGLVEISYLDCVKLAGHSCPTVAGAYLMAYHGLKALYPDSLPQRGSVKVSMKGDKAEGVTGVIGNVISYIVGGSDEAGFKGIQGNFSRNNLVAYNEPMQGEITLTRIDTNKSVSVSYDPSSILPDERMKLVMGKTLQGIASKEESDLFKALWQERVEKILLTAETGKKLITID